MGLLKSVDNVPGLDYYEYRDSSYYNKYEYRLRAKIPCIRYVWWCKKPEDLDKKIAGKSKTFGTIRKEDNINLYLTCVKFLIKIILQSNDSSKVPIIDDLRVLALQL